MLARLFLASAVFTDDAKLLCAEAQGMYAQMESSTRCYTEVLQIVKPKPEKAQNDGPLWRLPGPSFGATQRSAAPGMQHASMYAMLSDLSSPAVQNRVQETCHVHV